MNATITTFLKNAILNSHFGQTPYVIPPIYYVGLLENPTFTDGDTPIEHVGDGYARVAINNNKTTFTVSTLGTLDIDIEVTFPESTGVWGNQFQLAFWDGVLLADNLLMWGPADTLNNQAINIISGKIARFKKGSVVIS